MCSTPAPIRSKKLITIGFDGMIILSLYPLVFMVFPRIWTNFALSVKLFIRNRREDVGF
jgi:hypothetical protein